MFKRKKPQNADLLTKYNEHFLKKFRNFLISEMSVFYITMLRDFFSDKYCLCFHTFMFAGGCKFVFFFAKSLNKPMKVYIQDRRFN